MNPLHPYHLTRRMLPRCNNVLYLRGAEEDEGDGGGDAMQ